MNPTQLRKLAKLEAKVGHSVKSIVEGEECAFVNVDGVTVTIGQNGGYGIPSVRTYDEGLETAANALFLWNKQKRRDSRDLTKAQGYSTGHLNPTVDVDWECRGDVRCPCQNETDLKRRRHRSFRKN